MRKNLNKILAWTLAAALAFPTQAAAAIPASYGAEMTDSGSQDIQSENSASAGDQENEAGSAGSEGSDAESGTEAGAEEEGSTADQGESGGSENSEESGSEAAGEESASGSTEDGSGSETEENTGTEDAEEDTETGSDGTGDGENEAGESESSGTNAGESEEAGTDDTADDVTGETADSETDAETGTGESEAGTEDAEGESAADETAEGDPAAGETAADTEVVIVEPTAPEKPEETKKAEIKENETEVYTVSYEVIPEEGAEVKGKEEVKEGKDLTFKVTPEDGYKIESVSVNGEELTDDKEKKSFLFFFGDTYYEYKVQDVQEDLDVEILLTEDVLKASDGDTEVEIEEASSHALKDVSYVEISELGEDASVEEAIGAELSGKQIVDYRAVDITLYDAEGNETEPDGDVTVRISGVETDEAYDEVVIYHLMEEDKPARTVSRIGAMPAVNAVSELDDTSAAYSVQEVTAGVKDDIEETGVISFETDEFSTYVVVFVKDGNEDVSFVLKDLDGNDLSTEAFDVDAVSVGGDSINLRAFVEGNDLLQIEPDGKDSSFIFQYATTDAEGNDTLENDSISYTELAGAETVYLWYEDIAQQEIENVKVHLLDENGNEVYLESVSIGAGEITREKMSEALESLSYDTTGYVYKSAEVWDASDGSKQAVHSVFKSGDRFYIAKRDTVYMVLGDEQTLDVSFQKGNIITVNVTGAGENTGNQVILDGTAVGDGTHATQFVTGTNSTLAIPVAIGQGYNVEISGGRWIYYDSSEDASGTQVRNYTIEITDASFGGSDNITINVAFSKISLTFDFEFLTNYNENGSGTRFHGTQVYIGTEEEYESGDLYLYDDGDRTQGGFWGGGSDYPKATSYSIEGDSFVVQLVTDGSKEYDRMEYIMDSFGLNNQTVNVPGDNSSAVTEIKDQAGETIANLTITSKVDEDTWWGQIGGKGIYRTYTFIFTNVKGNITVTGGNFKNEAYNEIVYSTKTEGVGEVTGNNKSWDIGTQERNNDVIFRISPENGYYISRVTRTGASGEPEAVEFSNGNWYATRTATVYSRYDSRLNMVGIEAETIKYHFVYELDEAVRVTEQQTFELAKSAVSGVLGYTPSGEHAAYMYDQNGNIFAGWRLKGSSNSDYYTNGSTILATEIYGSRAVEFADNAPDAYIVLEPVYVPDENAKTYPVTVMIYSPDIPDGESVGITVNRGSVMTVDTVKTYPEVSEKTIALEEKGYLLDPAQSTASLTVDTPDKVFNLYYTDEPIMITAQFAEGSAEGGEIAAADSYNVESGHSVTILGAVGADVTFNIAAPNGYVIDQILVNGSLKETVQEPASSYQFTYSVNKDDISASSNKIEIAVKLKERPDIAYKVVYYYDGALGSKPSETAPEGGTGALGAEITVEAPEKAAVGEDNYVLVTENLTFTIQAEGNEFRIDYEKDNVGGGEDGEEPDGTPDKYQRTVTYKVENGTWADGSREAKQEVVTLLKDGEPSENGSAALTAPALGQADAGYTEGSWSPSVPGTIDGTTEILEYTYTYAARTDIAYKVVYYYDGVQGAKPSEAPAGGTGALGAEITVEAPETAAVGEDNYVLVTENLTFTIQAEGNEFRIDYEKDNVGGGEDGEEPDGTPDKYQRTVTYKVENGTWADGSREAKQEVVTLLKDGEPSENGSAALTAPALGQADAGYTEGSWSPSVPGTIDGTEETLEYTYTYAARTDIAYKVVYYYDGALGSKPSETASEGGTGALGAEITVEAPGTAVVGEDNYVLVTENLTFTIQAEENEFRIDYEKDNVGGGEDGEEPDGTPDKYQRTVTYKVENGTWADGSREAKQEVVTLLKDGKPSENGSAVLTAPGLGQADAGYTEGSWSPSVPGTIDGTEETLEYTYTYAARTDIAYKVVYYYDGALGAKPSEAAPEGGTGALGAEITVEAPGTAVVGEDNYVLVTENLTFTIQAEENEFRIDYEKDNVGGGEDGEEPDGTPDKYQVKIHFKVLSGSFSENDDFDGLRTIVRTLTTDGKRAEDGTYQIAESDIPAIYPYDGFVTGTWDPELTAGTTVITGTAGDGIQEEWFLHTCKPGVGEFFNITFQAGENGTFEDEQKTLTFVVKNSDAFPEIPVPAGNETEDGKWIFTGWVDKDGNSVESFPEKVEGDAEYTASYGFDSNNDNIPDEQQWEAQISPYDTTIYTGGDSSVGGGFPETELEVVIRDKEGTVVEKRPIRNESIESITVNGYKFEGEDADMHRLFKVIYWNEESGWVENDQEDGLYTASIVFTNEAAAAFPGSEQNDEGRLNGILTDMDGNPIPVKGADIGVEADYGTASQIRTMAADTEDTDEGSSYIVEAETGSLTVRKVEDMDANGATTEAVYRDVLAVPDSIDPNAARATAVIPDGAEFYINGNEIRANSGRSGIRLLTDNIYNEANKENLLVERAFREAYGEAGINSENAAERGYGYVLRYYDLVDSDNGNVWVESSEGVDVYVPYQSGTDQSTAFEIRHFIGLHRETGITEDAVPEAIATCTLDDMSGFGGVENTAHGIKFHTEGDQAFSPFIIMWKLDDGSTDTPDTDHGGHGGDGGSDSSGSSRPGAGPGASGSTYTAGVDGNWVHMDPDNIMIPISEDVPEGATPVTAPEWHQWKFILNNGTMLYDQWAYVKNPYAVGDQPDEGWFSFAENGIMEYGWYLDRRTGKWYWMHRTSDGMLGTMLTGWHYDDQDGKWYYMSPSTGEMLLGWQMIDGKWYFFNPDAPAVTWEFDPAAGGWTYNGSASRPYGSMYVDETTPDGYRVGADGAWIQ